MPFLFFFLGLVAGSHVIEVASDPDDWGSFVAGTGSEVAEGTDEVSVLTRSGALRGHLAEEVGVLLFDVGSDCFA